jgi:hypothetical protein
MAGMGEIGCLELGSRTLGDLCVCVCVCVCECVCVCVCVCE